MRSWHGEQPSGVFLLSEQQALLPSFTMALVGAEKMPLVRQLLDYSKRVSKRNSNYVATLEELKKQKAKVLQELKAKVLQDLKEVEKGHNKKSTELTNNCQKLAVMKLMDVKHELKRAKEHLRLLRGSSSKRSVFNKKYELNRARALLHLLTA